MNKEKGAFIGKTEEDSTVLLVYIKTEADGLKKALPLSYKKEEMLDHEYLIGIYLLAETGIHSSEGSASYTQLLNLIQETKMVDILANEYITIKKKCRNLSLNDYERGVTFARSQL